MTRVVVTDPNGLVLCDFQDGVGRTDTAGRYALFWELVTALRGNNVFRSEYGDGAFRSWAAVPITYRSMTQGRSTSTSTTPSRARCSRGSRPTCALSPSSSVWCRW